VPDHWHHHFDDTIAAGHGLYDENLARLLCEEGPECIRQMDAWGVGWASYNEIRLTADCSGSVGNVG
jgi:succinate dehydrogenase/fumarate reductase flavoprotein subunit